MKRFVLLAAVVLTLASCTYRTVDPSHRKTGVLMAKDILNFDGYSCYHFILEDGSEAKVDARTYYTTAIGDTIAY